MCEKQLVIELDFEDEEEGFGSHTHEIGQFTSGDGSCISYEQMEWEDVVPSWDDYDRSALAAAVEFFESFLSDASRKNCASGLKTMSCLLISLKIQTTPRRS